MDDVTQRLIKCFQSVFPDLPESKIPEASQSAISSWDSIAAVTLASVTAEEFGIPMNFDGLEGLNSFDNMRKWVLEELSRNGTPN